MPIPCTHKGIYFKSKRVKQTTVEKVLFSLGMLLLTVAAYADGIVLFSTAKGGIDVPPYRIPGITCGHGGRLIASAARLVCGTDPGY